MEKWQPPRFGDKKDNEVTCYTVAIPNLPMDKSSIALLKWCESLEGFVGVYPFDPKGIILIFKTENDAKGGRNLIRAKGIPVGKNIVEIYIDKKYVERGEKK